MKYFLIILALMISFSVTGQLQQIPLWPNGKVPNSTQLLGEEEIPERDILFIMNVQTPTIEAFIPSEQSANGAAVIICPGGGYGGVSYDWEGTDVAKWFNSFGVAAFVLKYRMPQAESVKVSHLAPIQDAQRAIRWLRSNSEKYNVDIDKVGIMGFSAGGHLAASLATQYDYECYKPIDDIDTYKANPDFMMLLYPVISMLDGVTHQGSKNNLLGKNPSKALIEQFSNELQVKSLTPPTILIHSADDKAVPVENSIRMYQSLIKNNIDATMHLFPKGGHGYAFGISRKDAPDWAPLAKNWLTNLLNE